MNRIQLGIWLGLLGSLGEFLKSDPDCVCGGGDGERGEHDVGQACEQQEEVEAPCGLPGAVHDQGARDCCADVEEPGWYGKHAEAVRELRQ